VSSALVGGNFFRIWKSGCRVEALQLQAPLLLIDENRA